MTIVEHAGVLLKRCSLLTMPEPIGYVSFPHFSPRGRETAMSSISTMCLQLTGNLFTFRSLKSCWSRPSKGLRTSQTNDASTSRECLLPRQTDDDRYSCMTQSDTDSVTTTPREQPTISTFPPIESHSTRFSTTARRSSTRDSSPAASFRSVSSKLRAGLTRRLTWRSEIPDYDEEEPEDASFAESETASANRREFIADLDALSLSQHEQELLRRMEQVSQTVPPYRHPVMREPTGHAGRDAQTWAWVEGVSSGIDAQPRLRLRGGGGDDEIVTPPSRGPRRRTTLPYTPPPAPLPDSARPTKVHWWFCGGGKGVVPTFGELRVRKEAEEENRKLVGFVGTVLGRRKVGKVGLLPKEDSSNGDAVMSGARGGSVKGSSRGRGLEVEDVAAESVKSAPKQSKAGSARSVVNDQVEAPVGSGGHADDDAISERVRNVMDDA